jgi:hypothetical protein
VGVVYVKVENLSDQVMPLTQGRAEPRRVIIADEERVAEAEPYARARETVARAPAPESVEAEPVRTIEERIERLERAETKRRTEPGDARVSAPSFFRSTPFVRNVKDLSDRLKLTRAQRDRVQAAVDHGKRRIEEIMKIPDEEGKSPYERREERQKKIEEALKSGKTDGIVTLAMSGMSHRNKKIPGQNATYGEEIDRVKKETREEMAQTLSQEQQEEFKDIRVDPMLGGSGAFQTYAVGFAGPGAKDGEGSRAKVIIEKGVAVEEVEEEDEGGHTD